MWPTISNIDPTISSKIKSYANDNLAASKLNAWIRVYSGANAGLILESNTNFQIFKAAGESGNSVYGNAQLSGTIGRTFGPGSVTTGIGRALRPSPIITSMNSKEGQDQISRTCEFSITCFSLEQLEEIQTYFMEPGYSVGVEWGWNTGNSALGLIDTSGGIVNQIADTTLNNKELSSKRIKTSGEYDVFLGFIVGSTVTSEGENFKVDVKLRGAPSLPTYLQSHNKITVAETSTPTVDTTKVKKPYDESQLTVEGPENTKDRRFKFMFNELPSFRQTKQVQDLKDRCTYKDFINFDKVVHKKIDEFMTAGGPEFYSVFTRSTVDVTTSEGNSVEVEKEKLFSQNKYIRFKLAVDILNQIGVTDKYTIGDKTVSFTLNTQNCVIGAFPIMYSTKASKLIIPGYVPNFLQSYFLKSFEIEQDSLGRVNKFNAVRVPNFTDFVQFGDLDKFGKKEKGGYWGYLEDLYVNFDMFKEKIEQKNKTIREILLDVLNEMSSAVNSFWNFQIVEGEDDAGNIVITVIDENWIGQNPKPDEVVTFKHNGIGSPFLNSSLDISIPAEMANKIINTRLGNDSQSDINPIKVGPNTFFNATTDLFLPRVQQSGGGSGTSGASGEEGDAASELSETKQKLQDALTNRDKLITREVLQADGSTEYYGVTPGNTNEQVIKTVSASGAVNYWLNVRVPEEYEIVKLQNAAVEEAQTAAAERVTSNIEKIDVVPKPTTIPTSITAAGLINQVETHFFVFCLDDTDFFDKIKNYRFETKSGGLSQPLPIKYSFTILGNSGIRRGDTFKIEGIPSKYGARGIFQVTEVEHSLSGMRWETTISSLYRQEQ